MQVNWQFNAQQYEPNQGFGIHPPAQKAPFTITNTAIKETKDKTGGYLVVEFTSPMGVVNHNYNINNQSAKAVEIAYGQLSALCKAVGRFQLDGNNECAALRGGQGLMDIGYQKGEEPDPNFPDRKGYTELKRVYDLAGNDPANKNATPQQTTGFAQQPNPTQGQPQGQPQPQGAAPMTQQPGGGWNSQPNPQPAQQQPQQAQPQGQAWQPGGGQPGTTPPWGNR